jgi:hypothetical protein
VDQGVDQEVDQEVLQEVLNGSRERDCLFGINQ